VKIDIQKLVEQGLVIIPEPKPKPPAGKRGPYQKNQRSILAQQAAYIYTKQKTLKEICAETGAIYELAKNHLYRKDGVNRIMKNEQTPLC
jgi:hypothetical protein